MKREQGLGLRGLFSLMAVLLGLLMVTVPAEILLRLLPVVDATKRLDVDDANPVQRFEPDRAVTWSKGWRLRRAIEHHVNNAGFFNPVDYEPESPIPLVAVVGDSYVEAQMVAYAASTAGHLGRTIGAVGRVYSFGVSGAPLSQYLAFASFARDHYRPDRLVVIVVGNDFDLSLAWVSAQKGYHLFFEDGHGDLVLRRRDRKTKTFKKIYRASALVRYLRSNLEIEAAPRRLAMLLSGEDPTEKWVGNTLAAPTLERLRDADRVIESFLAAVPEAGGLARRHILFVVDGVRPQLYDEREIRSGNESYFGRVRETFIDEARALGHPVVDMQPIFVKHHLEHGRAFEFVDDAHWNELGHELAARAIAKIGFLEELDRISPAP